MTAIDRLNELIKEKETEKAKAEQAGDWGLYDYLEGAEDAYQIALNILEEK